MADPGPLALRAAHRVIAPVVRRGLRVQVHGRHRVPGTGGALIAANHRSLLDHFLLAAASPRPIRFLGKVELARGIGGRVHLLLGMVPVQRGTGDRNVLTVLTDLLRDGQVVGIFPEGTRSRSGELGRFRSGMARLAAAAQVPVVPAALVGTAALWPADARPVLRRPPVGLLQVTFGDALDPPESDGAARRAFTERTQTVLSELCGQPLASGFTPLEGS